MQAYDRAAAVAYARRWAFGRNPAYLDFNDLGGDCTNFVSQCLLAGGRQMNYTPVLGWYYASSNDRTASWTGVEFLYDFLMSNQGAGPAARLVEQTQLLPGDVVQMGLEGQRYSHAALVVSVQQGQLWLAAHTNDAWMSPLSAFTQPNRRFLHIVRGGMK